MDISNKLAIDEINIANKRVLIRVDYDVPIENGKLMETNRIKESLETICYALDHDARSVILISHLGRPDGERNLQYSLSPVATELRKLLRRSVTFLHDCVGDAVETICMDPVPGSVILLENLQFHIEEEGVNSKMVANSDKVKDFRERLRKLGDIYVNDAFGLAQKYYSSIVAEGFDLKVAGLSMKRELACFTIALGNPPRPYLAILGGAEVRDKLLLIDKLLDKVDEMIIGGGLAFIFLFVCLGVQIGDSMYDGEAKDFIIFLWEKAKKKGIPIHLPVDFLVTDTFAPDAEASYDSITNGIPYGYMGLDIGPQTIETFSEIIYRANLIVWNGPMGVFEWDNFGEGTKALLEAVATQTDRGATSILGGEDTAFACKKYGAAYRVTHLSTGGGTCLELLEENVLPGVENLTSKVQPCPCKSSIKKDELKKDKRKYEPVELMKPKRDIRRNSRIKSFLEKERKDKEEKQKKVTDYGIGEEYGEGEGGVDTIDPTGYYMTDEYGNVITDESGNPILHQYQSIDQYGNPVDIQYGNQLEYPYGNQYEDPYGNQLEDSYGTQMTDEYGNPIPQQSGYPGTDEYGNQLTDDYANPSVGQLNQLAGEMGVHHDKQMGPPVASETHPMPQRAVHFMEKKIVHQIGFSGGYPMMGGMVNEVGSKMQYQMTNPKGVKMEYSVEINVTNPGGITYGYPKMTGPTNPTGYNIENTMAGANQMRTGIDNPMDVGVANQTGSTGRVPNRMESRISRVGSEMTNQKGIMSYPVQGETANQRVSRVGIPTSSGATN